MEKSYKSCQSCSMPLNQDPKGGGTNADGSTSTMYCSFCYEKGKFTQPDLSMKEMKEFLKAKMKEMGYSWFVGLIFASRVRKLERWKNK